MFGLVVGAFLSFASCGGGGGGGSCSKTNCAGCCDASGACQAGTQNTACGAAGNACQTCSGNQTCRTGGLCSVGGTGGGSSGTGGGSSGTGGGSSGTGGGSSGTGGGSSGTGGGSQTCTQITLANAWAGGLYQIVRDGTGAAQYSICEADNVLNGTDLFSLELYDSPGAETPAPYTANLASPTCGQGGTSACTFGNCNDCVQIYQNVQFSPFSYSKLFFGTSGTVNIEQKTLVENLADGGFAGGSLRATGMNVKLVEWNYASSGGQVTADAPVANGACIQITTVSWDGGW